MRVESLHAFVLWLKATGSMEYWVPITQIGSVRANGQWLSRNEFAELLINAARRVLGSQERALQLAGTNTSIN